MPGAYLYAWDSGAGAWVKVLANAAGKLIIDPSEIFEATPTDGEAGKAATSDWSHDHDADPDAHHASFVAADHTAIGNGAPHHAEAHTLASHTTKAHVELTGVTENQHHARQHALNAGADHTGRAALPQMPDGTLNYVLTGKGAGADPAYAAAAGIPSGVICMWHGAIANIPTGWKICDGNNGTPNLLARFVQGVATAATNPGTTGGATSKTTVGHAHTYTTTFYAPGGVMGRETSLVPKTDSITDIRPLFYDIAFIMKT